MLPCYKKKSETLKDNYRPISILPVFKIYDLHFIKYNNNLAIYFLNMNAVFARVC